MPKHEGNAAHFNFYWDDLGGEWVWSPNGTDLTPLREIDSALAAFLNGEEGTPPVTDFAVRNNEIVSVTFAGGDSIMLDISVPLNPQTRVANTAVANNPPAFQGADGSVGLSLDSPEMRTLKQLWEAQGMPGPFPPMTQATPFQPAEMEWGTIRWWKDRNSPKPTSERFFTGPDGTQYYDSSIRPIDTPEPEQAPVVRDPISGELLIREGLKQFRAEPQGTQPTQPTQLSADETILNLIMDAEDPSDPNDPNMVKARQLRDFFNAPNATERLQTALEIARSPADLITLMKVRRGDLPMDALGPVVGGRLPISPLVQEALGGGAQLAQTTPTAQFNQTQAARQVGALPAELPPGALQPGDPGYYRRDPQVQPFEGTAFEQEILPPQPSPFNGRGLPGLTDGPRSTPTQDQAPHSVQLQNALIGAESAEGRTAPVEEKSKAVLGQGPPTQVGAFGEVSSTGGPLRQAPSQFGAFGEVQASGQSLMPTQPRQLGIQEFLALLEQPEQSRPPAPPIIDGREDLSSALRTALRGGAVTEQAQGIPKILSDLGIPLSFPSAQAWKNFTPNERRAYHGYIADLGLDPRLVEEERLEAVTPGQVFGHNRPGRDRLSIAPAGLGRGRR